MKNIVGIGVCLFAMLGAATAQTSAQIKFTLPSAAVIGNTTLPAGNYTVHEMDTASGGSAVLDFVGPNGVTKNVLATETAIDSQVADRSEVVLKSDGERLRVDEIVIEGRGFGFKVVQ
jgi:hypothetical protein